MEGIEYNDFLVDALIKEAIVTALNNCLKAATDGSGSINGGDLVDAVADAIRFHGGEPEITEPCDECGEPVVEGGDGYDGMCGNCADKSSDDASNS